MIINEDYLDSVEVTDGNPADNIQLIDVVQYIEPNLLSN